MLAEGVATLAPAAAAAAVGGSSFIPLWVWLLPLLLGGLAMLLLVCCQRALMYQPHVPSRSTPCQILHTQPARHESRRHAAANSSFVCVCVLYVRASACALRACAVGCV